MGIENFGYAGGSRGHQIHGIVPVLVALHGESFGPQRTTTAVFTGMDVKGEQMEARQGSSVFAEQSGVKSKFRLSGDLRFSDSDRFLG
jgi:hypothetical protein